MLAKVVMMAFPFKQAIAPETAHGNEQLLELFEQGYRDAQSRARRASKAPKRVPARAV